MCYQARPSTGSFLTLLLTFCNESVSAGRLPQSHWKERGAHLHWDDPGALLLGLVQWAGSRQPHHFQCHYHRQSRWQPRHEPDSLAGSCAIDRTVVSAHHLFAARPAVEQHVRLLSLSSSHHTGRRLSGRSCVRNMPYIGRLLHEVAQSLLYVISISPVLKGDENDWCPARKLCVDGFGPYEFYEDSMIVRIRCFALS